jgi:hypothetical protein
VHQDPNEAPSPGMEAASFQHPVRLVMPYPDRFDRVQALLFTFLLPVGVLLILPQVLVTAVLMVGLCFACVIAFFAILFTGRYPRSLFEFARKTFRYVLRLNAYANVVTVGYPPMGPAEEDYGLDVDIPYPERSSRLWLFFAGIAVIPVSIWSGILNMVAAIVSFIASFIILFTGTMPLGWYEFIRKVWQMRMRMACFAIWMRNEYPPFGLDD